MLDRWCACMEDQIQWHSPGNQHHQTHASSSQSRTCTHFPPVRWCWPLPHNVCHHPTTHTQGCISKKLCMWHFTGIILSRRRFYQRLCTWWPKRTKWAWIFWSLFGFPRAVLMFLCPRRKRCWCPGSTFGIGFWRFSRSTPLWKPMGALSSIPSSCICSESPCLIGWVARVCYWTWIVMKNLHVVDLHFWGLWIKSIKSIKSL